MGKSEIILLIVSVVLGIAIMAGVVVPIMQDGKDMVQVKNIAQEISAVKDRMSFSSILTKPVDGAKVKLSGTNFLEASGDATYPYRAKNTKALFNDITYEESDNTGTFDINLAGIEASKVKLEESESIQKLCDATGGLTRSGNILTCKFKVE